MKKLILKFFVLGLVVVALLIVIGKPLTKVNPNKLFIEQFEASIDKGEVYDVYFYGSSKSFSTYNPRVFKEKLGVSSFNFGSSGQRLSTTNFFISETVDKQKPKLLIIDVYSQTLSTLDKDDKKAISHQLEAYDSFGFSLNKIKSIINNYSLSDLPESFFESIRNHKGWKTISTNHIDAQKTAFLKEEVNGYRGWQYTVGKSDSYLPLTPTKSLEDGQFVIADDHKKNLNILFTNLRLLDIPVLFVSAPSLRELKDKAHANFSEGLKKYVIDNNFDFLDLNFKIDEIGLMPKDFRDKIHLNNVGANKVSAYLAKWLNKNYNIGNIKTSKLNIVNYIKEGIFDSKKQNIDIKLTDKINCTGANFVKTDQEEITFLMEVNSQDLESIKAYSIMLHAAPKKEDLKFLSKKAIKNKSGYEIWDFKPEITNINGKNYLIKTIKTKIEAFDYINLAVYSAKGYNGVLFGKHKIDFNKKLEAEKVTSNINYANKFVINKNFIKDFKLEKFEVVKIDKKALILKFLLNDNVSKKVVENYSVTVRVVPTEQEKVKNGITKTELMWDFKPTLIEEGGKKYMQTTVKTKLKQLKQLRFALYHREGYQGKVLSKIISVNHINLK